MARFQAGPRPRYREERAASVGEAIQGFASAIAQQGADRRRKRRIKKASAQGANIGAHAALAAMGGPSGRRRVR